MSPLGRLLTLTDYLGKLRMLVEQERAFAQDPSLFGGLPPYANQAYGWLGALDEQGKPAV